MHVRIWQQLPSCVSGRLQQKPNYSHGYIVLYDYIVFITYGILLAATELLLNKAHACMLVYNERTIHVVLAKVHAIICFGHNSY